MFGRNIAANPSVAARSLSRLESECFEPAARVGRERFSCSPCWPQGNTGLPARRAKGQKRILR